eukprot:g7859.t1
MVAECTTEDFVFQPLGRREIIGRFDGGSITSDAGGLLLRELEAKTRLLERFASCFTDHRDPKLIEHSVEELIKQRIFGIALGYEDVNDHDELRHDPLLAVLVGKRDATGKERVRQRDKGKALAGKSTLNRLELTPPGASPASRYKKIVAECTTIERFFVDAFLDAHDEPPEEIVLDFDATDDPLHGHQLGRFFHGYYHNYCYLPLYVFCGPHLLCAKLRPSDIDGAAGTVAELQRIVSHIRERWPDVRILLRGDGGFCREPIMHWCEKNRVNFLLGLAKNDRLKAEIVDEMEQAKAAFEQTGRAARVFKDFTYRTRESWSRSRRVVGKAEHLKKGENPRFVVTSLSSETIAAAELYEQKYCARGEMENRIKEQQLFLFADRTSCATMRANQLRLWFSSVAYVLLQTLRDVGLKETELERAQCDTIRLKVLKIGAQVRVTFRKAASMCRLKRTFAAVAAAFIALGTTHSMADEPIVRVEEDWTVEIGSPDPEKHAPQILIVMSPTETPNWKHAIFELNHRSLPDYSAGGMQLQAWLGEFNLDHRAGPDHEVLSTVEETVKFTMRMKVDNGCLHFEVVNGTSETWGNFGGQGYLKTSVATGITHLGNYNKTTSTKHSKIGFAKHRVKCLKRTAIRYYSATGLVSGAIIVLCLAVLVMVFAFTAFTVDIGFISLTKGQLQKSSDAAALSSILDLIDGLGPSASKTQDEADAAARETAVLVAAANRAGGLNSVKADGTGDVRLGNVTWNPATSTYTKTWGAQPYNMVEVTLRRSEGQNAGSNDGPLPLFFAPMLGSDTANVSANGIAAVLPASGFRVLPGSPGNAEVLPIALDEGSWNDMIAGGGADDWTWNEATKTVTAGGDGVREINLYPTGSNLLPPGNRGTVDFGSSNNSTADISRQILYGLNADDLSYFGGTVSTENGPLTINGDTGLSAGIKDELEAIIGQPRAIPIFTTVSGPGNNAMYTIVRFVGIRILKVKLTGKNKYVTIQPAVFSSQYAIPGSGNISTGSIITKPMLIP